MDHLGAEHPVIAVGGVDVKSAARPGHRTDEKCVRIHFCLPSTHSRIASAEWAPPEVHRDGCGGPCRRASPSGEEGTTWQARAVWRESSAPRHRRHVRYS